MCRKKDPFRYNPEQCSLRSVSPYFSISLPVTLSASRLLVVPQSYERSRSRFLGVPTSPSSFAGSRTPALGSATSAAGSRLLHGLTRTLIFSRSSSVRACVGCSGAAGGALTRMHKVVSSDRYADRKEMNSVGMQSADLIAYPAACSTLRANAPHPAEDSFQGKIGRRRLSHTKAGGPGIPSAACSTGNPSPYAYRIARSLAIYRPPTVSFCMTDRRPPPKSEPPSALLMRAIGDLERVWRCVRMEASGVSSQPVSDKQTRLNLPLGCIERWSPARTFTILNTH